MKKVDHIQTVADSAGIRYTNDTVDITPRDSRDSHRTAEVNVTYL